MTKNFTKTENQKWAQALSGKMSSACLILRSGGEVLMVKAGYKDHWTFPGGIVDDNEPPKTTALRETFEEVGLDINADECSFFTVVYTASKDGDRDRFNFSFATDLKDKDVALSVPNAEIVEAKWVSYDQVAKLSRGKASYVHFQRLLMSPSDYLPYVEIR